MSPGAETLLFAGLALICFGASLFACADQWIASVASSGAILAFWAINTAFWELGALRDWSLAIDSAFTLFAFLLYLTCRGRWALLLSALYFVDVVLDHAHLIGRLGYTGWAWWENGIFVAQLLLASSPGWQALARSRRPPISA